MSMPATVPRFLRSTGASPQNPAADYRVLCPGGDRRWSAIRSRARKLSHVDKVPHPGGRVIIANHEIVGRFESLGEIVTPVTRVPISWRPMDVRHGAR
jgi:hypothetical protein